MEEKNTNYLTYAIAMVVLLIAATFAITFAYYKVDTTFDSTLVDISASLECIDLELSSSGNTLSLSYNYPITDELAQTTGSITPVTISVTNNCSTSKNYTLALSTLSLTNSTSSYIEDSKIRFKVVKNNDTYKSAAYLNSLGEVSTTNQAYKDLTGTNGELATKYPDYTVKKIYAIEDEQTILTNATNTYSIYLWVDYYEGDSNMYTGTSSTHDESYDNTTAGKKFAAAISLSLNP